MKLPIDPFELAKQLAGRDKGEAEGVLRQRKKKDLSKDEQTELPIYLNQREIQYLVRYCEVRSHQIKAQNNLGHGRKEELSMLSGLLGKFGEDSGVENF